MSEPIGNFQSTLEPNSDDFIMNMSYKANDFLKHVTAPEKGHIEVDNSRDHKLYALTDWATKEGSE